MSVTNIPSGMHIQVDPLMFRDAETIESYTPAGLSPWTIVCHLVTPNTGCPLKLETQTDEHLHYATYHYPA